MKINDIEYTEWRRRVAEWTWNKATQTLDSFRINRHDLHFLFAAGKSPEEAATAVISGSLPREVAS